MEKQNETKKPSKLSIVFTIIPLIYIILKFTGLLEPLYAYLKLKH